VAEKREGELLAREMSRLAEAVHALEERVSEVVNARLEVAALTTAPARTEKTGEETGSEDLLST
jgi:hypothetical protein